MKELDFYFHDGCLSHQALLLLAKELQDGCPDWEIRTHRLQKDDAAALGFHVLPAIVINGSRAAAGTPQKDWLLERMKESEQANKP